MNKIMNRHKVKTNNIYPTLDLHGETTATLKFIVNDFINDNLKLQNEKIIIIHGKVQE